MGQEKYLGYRLLSVTSIVCLTVYLPSNAPYMDIWLELRMVLVRLPFIRP